MAGERTPDTSPGHSGSATSTDNDISLREHMQRQLDTQRAYFERIMADHKEHINERYALHVRSQDAAAQSAEKAVAAALLAAERAVSKAELANDKRFDGVNEFRAQLNDQAATFMPRNEADVRITAMNDRVEATAKKVNELELRVQSRLDLNQGNTQGIDKAWGYLIGLVGLLGGLVALIIATQ